MNLARHLEFDDGLTRQFILLRGEKFKMLFTRKRGSHDSGMMNVLLEMRIAPSEGNIKKAKKKWEKLTTKYREIVKDPKFTVKDEFEDYEYVQSGWKYWPEMVHAMSSNGDTSAPNTTIDAPMFVSCADSYEIQIDQDSVDFDDSQLQHIVNSHDSLSSSNQGPITSTPAALTDMAENSEGGSRNNDRKHYSHQNGPTNSSQQKKVKKAVKSNLMSIIHKRSKREYLFNVKVLKLLNKERRDRKKEAAKAIKQTSALITLLAASLATTCQDQRYLNKIHNIIEKFAQEDEDSSSSGSSGEESCESDVE